jgi:glutamate---cysteine ligase / carboxylate-amine ligase
MLTSIRPPDERSRGLHPCASLDDLRRQHTERRKSLAEAAASVDARIAALGTCPLAGETSTTEDSRYHRLIERFGSVTGAEEFTCGQHVHISVASDEEAVAAIDRLQQWLPVVRALSANSPFWHEHDTDYASYRSVLWHRWPTAGPTQPFGCIANYRDTVAALCRALVEESVRSWRAGEPAPSIRAEYLQAAGWAAARFGLSDRLFALPTADRSGRWTRWTISSRSSVRRWSASATPGWLTPKSTGCVRKGRARPSNGPMSEPVPTCRR